MKSKTFGWHGVQFKAPEDWELAVDKGAFNKGFMRIDDPLSPRIGLRWDTVKAGKAKPMRDTIRRLKKEMRKKDKNVRFLRETSTKICGHPARYFYWRSSLEGYVLLWYCPKTDRAFIAEFYFAGEEYAKVKLAVDNVFESFECHTEKAQRWTIFGLDLQVPSEFKVMERSFYAARLHLAFESKEAAFILDRASFAETLIAEKYENLQDWFQKDCAKELRKKYRRIKFGKAQEGETLGHTGLVIPASYKEGALFGRKYRLETRIWMCNVENKIYAVTTVQREGVDDKVAEGLSTIITSLRCHSPAGQEPSVSSRSQQSVRSVETAAQEMPDE